MGNINCPCFSGITQSNLNPVVESPKKPKHSTLESKACFSAARLGKIDVLKTQFGQPGSEPDLLINWANPDMLNYTSVHIAAANGHAEVIKLLLRMRGKVESYADNCETPLIAAARAKQETVCKVLLDHGADIDAVSEIGTGNRNGKLSGTSNRNGKLNGESPAPSRGPSGSDGCGGPMIEGLSVARPKTLGTGNDRKSSKGKSARQIMKEARMDIEL